LFFVVSLTFPVMTDLALLKLDIFFNI